MDTINLWKFLLCLMLCLTFIKYSFSQDFDAEVIKFNTLCEAEKNRLTTTDSIIIQINNRAGEEYTKIELEYSKIHPLDKFDAWIEAANGQKIRSLKNSEIVDRNAFSHIAFYQDEFVKCFQLKHNTYPYRIAYTYKSTTSTFISLAWWYPAIHHKIPTLQAKLKLVVPKGLQFQAFCNKVKAIKQDSTSKNIVYEWTSEYKLPLKPEIYSDDSQYLPYAIVNPMNFNYGVEGSLKNWAAYGNWQSRLIENLDQLPEDERRTISNLIKNIKEKREIVKAIYHYLQDQTRYINVSIGIGGFKPYPAAFVATNKYGDCKGLTNYMKAMLKYAGIESLYMNIYASENNNLLNDKVIGPHFNHAILAVPLDKDTIWLDNTDKFSPFGYVGTFIQNRDALIISQENGRLIRTPAMTAEDNTNTFKIGYDLKTNGKADVNLNCTFKGNQFEHFDAINCNLNHEEKDKFVKEFMPFENYEVITWDLKKQDRDSAKIELNAQVSLSKYLKPLADEFYFSTHSSHYPAFEAPKDRNFPVNLSYPISTIEQMIYKLPAGFQLKTKPDTFNLKSKYGFYELAISSLDGTVVVNKRFVIYAGMYALEEYPKFYEFLKSLKKMDQAKIVIQPLK